MIFYWHCNNFGVLSIELLITTVSSHFGYCTLYSESVIHRSPYTWYVNKSTGDDLILMQLIKHSVCGDFFYNVSHFKKKSSKLYIFDEWDKTAAMQ